MSSTIGEKIKHFHSSQLDREGEKGGNQLARAQTRGWTQSAREGP